MKASAQAAAATVDAAGGPVECVETWRSFLFFGPSDVWKVQKPMRSLGRDTTTLTGRRAACEEELRLNRELAPDVYRGLVPVASTGDGTRRIDGDGDVVDWAIGMARLPELDRADCRLRDGRLGARELAAAAREIARFHRRAPRVEQGAGEATRAVSEWVGLDLGGGALPDEARQAETGQRRFLAHHGDRLAERARIGRVRDVHGELGLDHLFVDADCHAHVIGRLGFDERLRRVDVCADIALLAADLGAAGRADLSEQFLADYAREANDFDLYPLVDFYASLRASMRGKLEWLRASHCAGVAPRAERHRSRARRYFLLAVAARCRTLLPPVVVAVGGQVASGKSTVADALAAEIGAPVVNSDRVRDSLLGSGGDASLHEVHWERAYERGFMEQTYAEVARRAGCVLRSGRPVVVDGCLRSAAQRASVRALAAEFGYPLLFVEARTSEAVQRERLRLRSRRDGEPDATWLDIADALRREWEPWDELDSAERVTVDTSRTVDRCIADLRRRLPTWPERLRG